MIFYLYYLLNSITNLQCSRNFINYFINNNYFIINCQLIEEDILVDDIYNEKKLDTFNYYPSIVN